MSELRSYTVLTAASLAAVLAVLLLGAQFSPLVQKTSSHPSDAALEEVFGRNEEKFNSLIHMSRADAKVVRIAPTFTWLDDNARWPRAESELGFSVERWDEYRQLFKELGLKEGIQREPNGDVIQFIASSEGLLTAGSGKGYIYSTRELSPLYDSLNEPPPTEGKYVYKRLKEHWYLFYYSN